MVLSAHPDDDVLGAATLLLRGPTVAVVQLTDGVPRAPRWRSPSAEAGEEGYRAQRRRESLEALAVAGLPASALHALGGRDLESIDEAAALARRLATLVERVCPARLCTHPYEGGHPDHDTAALVARAALSLASAPVELREMTSYHAGPGGALEAGVFLPGVGVPEEVRVLAPDERDAKRRMLAAHASQAAVLAQFSVDVERFRPAPRHDFGRPPHPGPVLHELRGWGDGARWRTRATDALAELGLGSDGCR